MTIIGKAKACIKRFLHAKEDDELKQLGREILTNQFKNEKIRFSERNLKSVLDKFELKKIDELFLKIGKGEPSPNYNYFVIISRKRDCGVK